ncbi:MAG: FAD-dependent oxidoreductase [Prevotellaceae bacterium]|nr:FAD-dependent oxidoreductase [Prevotellaceae bacterium]
MKKYDIVVIGSGLGGLECAYILARAGRSVLLLERERQAGGCIQSYKRHGLSYDTGFHYVGGLDEGQSLYSAFRYLGLLNLPWKKMDAAFDRITIEDRSYSLVQGYDSFVNELAKSFPNERSALNKYADMLKLVSAHQYDSLNPNIVKTEAYPELFDVNAWDYLHELFDDELLINVLCGNSLKMELRKESLPLFTFAHVNSGFIESSWRLQGSGSMIADTLLDTIISCGGEIIYNAEVKELILNSATL